MSPDTEGMMSPSSAPTRPKPIAPFGVAARSLKTTGSVCASAVRGSTASEITAVSASAPPIRSQLNSPSSCVSAHITRRLKRRQPRGFIWGIIWLEFAEQPPKNLAMEERDYQSLLVEHDGHIVTLTFNKPEKKNPLSQELVNELLWALDDAEADDDVRVIILTGAGNAFSAGADLKGMTADRGNLEKKGEFDDLMLRFGSLNKPIVARIPGYVMGGAMGIVACCHFAIACESAILATPEIKRGLFPMMIMAVLQRVVHSRELMKLLLLGDKITATKA
ncbi:MAG: enoyl-CoA hydratase/isomerase family protein, partial [Deltaproteobacteria bacterium]